MTPHFFKAYSRQGIRYLPYGSKEFAFGVEEAPSAILTPKFLSNFPSYELSEFTFTLPEKLPVDKYMGLVLSESLKFAKLIQDELKPNERQIVIGGDHSVTFPSTLADINRHGSNIGFIHFDSHADMNLYKTSPSKNFHGMYLRIFFDRFDLPEFDQTVPNKIPLKNLLFVGDLELNKEEREFFKSKKPSVMTRHDMSVRRQATLDAIQNFVKRFGHVHISFDIDVFEKSLVSATGTPAKRGFGKREVFEILQAIKDNARSFTLDIAEVNPKRKGADQTVNLAQEVILRLLA